MPVNSAMKIAIGSDATPSLHIWSSVSGTHVRASRAIATTVSPTKRAAAPSAPIIRSVAAPSPATPDASASSGERIPRAVAGRSIEDAVAIGCSGRRSKGFSIWNLGNTPRDTVGRWADESPLIPDARARCHVTSSNQARTGTRMPSRHRAHVWTARVIGLAIASLLWTVSTTQSGYSVVELLVFTGPAIVLAIAASWSAAAFSRDTWTWTSALRASGLGSVFLLPIIAASIAFFAAWNTNAVLLTFILGAWLALATGVLVAATRALWNSFRKMPPEARARLVLLRPSRATRAHRSPARVGPRPRWAEYQ